MRTSTGSDGRELSGGDCDTVLRAETMKGAPPVFGEGKP